MSRGIELSTLSALADDAGLDTASTIEAAEHNTHRTNRRSLVNDLLTALQDSESLYAGSGEPTDKPQGKVYFDTATGLWMGYKTTDGTPVAFLEPATAYLADLSTGGSATGRVGFPINVDMTTVSLAGSTGVLESYTLPGGTLARDGQFVHIVLWGTKAFENAAATVQARFNASAQFEFTIAQNATNWFIEWYIVRTGASAQDVHAHIIQNRADTGLTNLADSGSDTETLSGDLAIDLNLSAVHGSDTVVKEAMIVTFGNI